MRRIAKAFAVFIPLFVGVACSDECKGPEDCAPGELCVRPAEANGDRGPAACVPSVNANLVCITDMDCNNGSAAFQCVAQRCVLRTTTTPTTASDAGVVDTGVVDGSVPDGAVTPDTGVVQTPCELYCDNVQTNCNSGNNRIYQDRTTCLSTCERFPSVGTATSAGNSVECRTFHAGAPASANPDAACINATPNGGGVCGTRCEGYCDQVMTNCTGANAQFPDRNACLATCAAFPVVDSATVTAGNSVECRTYHGSFPSRTDATVHCAHAGTSGGGLCGTRCDAYCDQATANCGTQLYADRTSCMLACPTFSATTAPENATTGNSLQCRTYHASFPSRTDSTVHCPHAGIAGGDACGTYCEVYCDFLDDNCTGANAQYASRAACETACAGIPTTGTSSATLGDSIQCRSYHASFPSAADPATHCPHAGETPTDQCI